MKRSELHRVLTFQNVCPINKVCFISKYLCYFYCVTEQDHIPVMRGQWFIDGTWLPLEEEESDLIEQEHLNHFRGHQMQDTFETDLVVRTVDSKDGEQMDGYGNSSCSVSVYFFKHSIDTVIIKIMNKR